MSHRHRPRLVPVSFAAVVFLLSLALFILDVPLAVAQGKKYTLTIYVNEGPGTSSDWIEGSTAGVFTGHVFIGLSDGNATVYRGYYPKNQHSVQDDYEDAATRNYDLKKTFQITEDGYKEAMQAAQLGPLQNEQWRKELTHCGAFAEAVARLAGLSVEVPEGMGSKVPIIKPWMRTRPGNFADYLRGDSHEGDLVLIPQEARNKLDTAFFAGTWMAGQGRTVVIINNGAGFMVSGALPGNDGEAFREFHLNGETLVSQHPITAQEVSKFNLPASVVNQVVGAVPVQMILAMSTNGRAIRAEHDYISGVNVGRLYHNGRPTNQYRINEFVPNSTYEIWERVR